jgi:hypothetical protein
LQAPQVLAHLFGAQLNAHLLSTTAFLTQVLHVSCHDGSSAQVNIIGTDTVEEVVEVVDIGPSVEVVPLVSALVGSSVGELLMALAGALLESVGAPQ